jgi:hypothetical protein
MSSHKTAIPKRTRKLILSSETLRRLDSFTLIAAGPPTTDCLPPQTQQGPACLLDELR